MQPKTGLLGVLALVLCLSSIVAASTATYDVAWHVIGTGGGRSTSLAYNVYGTVGQPSVGYAASTPYRVYGGFWTRPEISGTPTATSVATGTRTATATRTASATTTAIATRTVTVTRTPVAPTTATATVTPVPLLIVNSTDDANDGVCNATHCSLREAINAANIHSGPDIVTFNIPIGAPGFNPMSGVWTIHVSSALPPLANTTTIDATTQTTNRGDTNPLGPEVEVDGGTLIEQGVTGFRIGSGVTFKGLAIYHFAYAVWVDGLDAVIADNYIGTDATGLAGLSNGLDGVLVIHGASGNIIEDNLIAGNRGDGIRISGDSTDGNTVRNNRIGVNSTGTAALPNGYAGVVIEQGAHDNIVADNLISGNTQMGVHLTDAGTTGNAVRRNRIGISGASNTALPNGSFGLAIFNGPSDNLIGPDNLIAYNTNDGILVDGSDSFTSTIGNTITANRITQNGGQGIRTFRGGNTELRPPIITGASATQVRGTACPGCLIEVFSDTGDEGAVYEGSAGADDSGQWLLAKAGGLAGPFVTATATDSAGNTSAFAAPVSLSATPTLTPTRTLLPSPTGTQTPRASVTLTLTPTWTPSPSRTSALTRTPTPTYTPILTPTATVTQLPTRALYLPLVARNGDRISMRGVTPTH